MITPKIFEFMLYVLPSKHEKSTRYLFEQSGNHCTEGGCHGTD